MKKPNKELFEEHSDISAMLLIMSKVAAKLKIGTDVEREQLDKLVEFVKVFADQCHHGKEEDILFPLLEKMPVHKKIVNEFLGEHQTGRDYIRGISESLKKYAAGSSDAYHIALNLNGYVQLLTVHIRRENALFAAIDKELPEDLWKKIEADFERVENEVLAGGKHEKYHGWIKEFKEIYLN
jgi:hemerythrin-like domain-containing protein